MCMLPAGPPLQCHPVSQTPIYDQLRGEHINVDVPASGADPQNIGQSEQNDLFIDASSVTAVFPRPPGPGADLSANLLHPLRAYPASQPTDDGQGTAMERRGALGSRLIIDGTYRGTHYGTDRSV